MRSQAQKPWAMGLALLLAAGGVFLALAQQPPPSEQKQGPIQPREDKKEEAPYALRVDVPVVSVDLSVVDPKSGTFISGLKKEHFRVYMDGVEQEIVAFAPTEAPLTTVLLVEASPYIGYIRYDNLDAAYLFLRQLRKDDWVALVSYDMRPRIEVDFTHDANEIINRLRYMEFGGFSEVNMYDAVIDTLDRLKDVEGKKSIIVIGTGLDTFSKHTWDDTRKAARNAGVPIFTIGMGWPVLYAADRVSGNPRYSRGAQRVADELRLRIQLAEAQMRDLSDQTGGRFWNPRFITQLPGIYEEVGTLMRNQYSLAFRPKPFQRDGKFHKIELKLVAPDGTPLKVLDQNRKELKVEIYARKGFYAPES
ncbi:MAG TPA: VWA domain-containing protein [Candidatus Xenobia bacterium]|nr:VWA domain-containing protein [Candidatus Xenobia bacterium]